LRRRPFVFELRDLWPDSIVAVGAMRDTPTIRLLRKLEYFLYRRSARIVSVTESFKTVLSSNGIDPTKISVVPNGVDVATCQPGSKPIELEGRLGLTGKFVAAYVGTIGMAHGLDTVLSAARTLRGRKDIAFVLVGTGAEHASLERQCRENGLDNVIFVGAVSKTKVWDYWKLCDVALVLLRDTPLFAHVLPSKMFEAMGMDRPIILGVRGESQRVLEMAGAGIAITPESSDELVKALLILADDRDLRIRLGMSGREFAIRQFNRDALAQRMLAVLEGCVAANQGS